MLSHRDFLIWGAVIATFEFVAMLIDGAFGNGTQFSAFNDVLQFQLFGSGTEVFGFHVPTLNMTYFTSMATLVTWNKSIFDGVMLWVRFVLMAGTFAFIAGMLIAFGPMMLAALGTLVSALRSPVVLAGGAVLAIGGFLYSLIT